MLKMDLLVSCGEPWPSQQLWMLWQMKSLYSVEVKRDVFQNVNMMSYTIKEVHKYGFPIRKKEGKSSLYMYLLYDALHRQDGHKMGSECKHQRELQSR